MAGTPFRHEGPVGPDLLIDREPELELLSRRAADRVAVRLVAPRRFGKTSLLLAHAEALRAASWHVAHVDCSRVGDMTDVGRRIAAAYAPLDAGWLRSHLGGLLARIGVSLTLSPVAVSFQPRRDAEAAEEAVYRLLDLPALLYERTGEPTLVVFDEFQDVLTARDDLDGFLRSRIQYHADAAAYVYAGSEPSLMKALFEDRDRPLYGQADPLALGPLPLDVLGAELYTRFDGEGLDPGEALGQIVAFCEGHPQRTMLLAYRLADRLATGDAAGTAATASEVIGEGIAVTASAHAATWDGTGRMEQIVLAALAEGRAATSRDVADEHRVSHTGLAQAARRLADRGHMRRAGRGWAIVDPLLAEWIRRR